MQALKTNEVQNLKQRWNKDVSSFGLDKPLQSDNGRIHPLGFVDVEDSKTVIMESLDKIKLMLQQHQQRERQLPTLQAQQQKEESEQFRAYCKLWKDHKKTTLQKEHISSIVGDCTQKLADYYTHQQSHATREVKLKASMTIKNEKVLKALEDIAAKMKHFYEVMTLSRSEENVTTDNFCEPMDYENVETNGTKLLYYTIANSTNNVDVICNTVGSVQSVKLEKLPESTTDPEFNAKLTNLLQHSKYEEFVNVLVVRFQDLHYYKDHTAVISDGNVLELLPPVCVSWEIGRDIWKFCNPTQQTQDVTAEGVDLQHLLSHKPSSHRYGSHIYSFHTSDSTDNSEMKKFQVIRGVTLSKISFPSGTKIAPIFQLLRQQLIYNDLFNSCFSTQVEATQPTYNIEVACTPPSTILLRTIMTTNFNFLSIEIVIRDGQAYVKMDGDVGKYATRVLRETCSIPILMHFILVEWPKLQ